MNRYRYCGFVIQTPLEFPELEATDAEQSAEIIAVERATVQIPGISSLHRGPNWAIGREETFWWLDGIATFRIDAESIQVDFNDSVPEQLIRSLILEAPMTLVMQHRGSFCLAVSSVTDGTSVTAYRFLPGGGASTAAAWQVCKGTNHRHFCDTLLRIEIDGNSRPIAWPQGSGSLLWPRSLKLLDLLDHPSQTVRPDIALSRVRLKENRRPLPLTTIVTAGTYRKLKVSSQEDYQNLQSRQPFKVAALKTAGRLWIDPMGRTEEHFLWCLAIAKYCKVKQGSLANSTA